ncbi:MAG: sodium/solute symporter, partial [Lentisphaeraceae bacterium]|nr:sodium/solute symporter [Lentisphaeraceae bacterium]
MIIKLQFIDYLVIAIYVCLLVGLGLWISYKDKSSKDQFTAGHSLGWFSIGLSLFGTNIGPQFLIAMCGGAYAYGLCVAGTEWIPWITLFLLGIVFAPYYLKAKVTTMPQFLEKRFGSWARKFLSWYSLISITVIWMGVQLLVGGKLLSPILGISIEWCFVLLLIVATVFTLAGGLKAVVVTDSLQSILIIVGAGIISYLAVVEVGGIDQLWTAKTEGGERVLSKEFLSLFRTDEGAKFPWYTFAFGFPILAFYYWCTDQTIVQRTLGAIDQHEAQKGVLFSAYLKIIPPLIFVIPGLCWRLKNPGLEQDKVFLHMVANLLEPGMVGFMIAIMIAMLISSVDSGINSFSTVFSMDIYSKQINPNANEDQIRKVGKISTVAASVLALIIAIALANYKGGLFVLIQKLIGAFAPPLAAVFLMGVVSRKITPAAGKVGLIGGGIVSILCGWMMLKGYPNKEFWPHHFIVAFYLFVGICIVMCLTSM